MSKADILSELPLLSSSDRAEIMDQLWRLEESQGPTDLEKATLEKAQATYDLSPHSQSPWLDVEARLRRRP